MKFYYVPGRARYFTNIIPLGSWDTDNAMSLPSLFHFLFEHKQRYISHFTCSKLGSCNWILSYPGMPMKCSAWCSVLLPTSWKDRKAQMDLWCHALRESLKITVPLSALGSWMMLWIRVSSPKPPCSPDMWEWVVSKK